MSKIKERNIPSTVGQLIRVARNEKKYSLKKLGDMVNVSASYICRIEKGQRECPSINILTGIATAVGLDPVRLLDLASETNEQPELKDIVRNGGFTLSGKSPEPLEQKLVMRFLDALEQKEWTRVNRASFVVAMMEAITKVNSNRAS